MTSSIPDAGFEALLNYLWQNHHFDFTNYKRSSLMRRIQYRMQQVVINSYDDYQVYLGTHLAEFDHLFNVIEINYTCFFRDSSAWEYIRYQVIPLIVASKSPSEPIRVWSAGCSSGEETYTIAMILAEALGLEQFHQRVRIFATDIDQTALQQARQGSYPQQQVTTEVPSSLIDQYFDLAQDRYIIHKSLRYAILFHYHNMIQTAPMSQIDLLISRNTLIYFGLEAQAKVLTRFHFSLKDEGFLFLGKAEIVPAELNLFKAVSTQHHIFAKKSKADLDRRLIAKAFRRPKATTPPLEQHDRN